MGLNYMYETILTCNDPVKETFEKLWDKENILMTSIFSLSHNEFYLPKKTSSISVVFILLSENAFIMDLVKFKIVFFW